MTRSLEQSSRTSKLRHRPGGIVIANALGSLLRALTPRLDRLTVDRDARYIMESAPSVGLNPEIFGEGLKRLTRSLDREAQLTPIGAAAVATQLKQLLKARAQLQVELAEKPHILEQPIEQPIFITGLPRTGSTLLHNLIAQDPDVSVPKTWEVMYPTPAPGLDPGSDARNSRRCDRRLALIDHLAPMFRRIHPFGAELPQECIAITAMAFMSIVFHTTYRVPDYQAWLEETPHDEGYLFHRRFLQYLQQHRSGRRWVLKAPGHLMSLDALLRVYPDACVVQTHRDPVQVAASIASHGVVLRWAFSDRVDPCGVGAYWKDYWARHLEHALAVRRNISPEKLVDIQYHELLRDPVAVVERIYEAFGLSLSARARVAMQDFLADNPQHKHGPHRYNLRQFGFDRDELERRFAAYRERFELRSEMG